MTTLTYHKKLALLALVALGAVATGLLLTQPGSSRASAIALPTGVTTAELASAHIALTPATAAASISQADAVKVVEGVSDQPVLNTQLAHCTNDLTSMNEDCWVISLQPQVLTVGGVLPYAGGATVQGKAAVFFMDAQTGKLIEGFETS